MIIHIEPNRRQIGCVAITRSRRFRRRLTGNIVVSGSARPRSFCKLREIVVLARRLVPAVPS